MHAEWGEISAETAAALNAARRAGGRIVAVGTTALRLLETAAAEDGSIRPFAGETDIFITPGYRFKAVDLLAHQLPPAALDPVHAGLRLQRPRHHAGGLRARDPLRAIASTPTAMPACSIRAAKRWCWVEMRRA